MADNSEIKELKHSLASPITNILCALELFLIDGKIDLSKTKELVSIRESAEQLRILVGGRDSALRYQEKFSLNTELKNIAKSFQKPYGVKIDLHLYDAKITLFGNKMAFANLMHILLCNAAEAYDDHLVERKVSVSMATLYDRVIIYVNDHGRGMSQLVSLFLGQRYFSTKKYKGGLGIVLAKSELRKHFGGKITFRSQKNVGTTAILEIPYKHLL